MRFLIAACALACLSACGVSAADRQNVGSETSCSALEYGNNVVYFDCTEASFANALSNYKASNPDLVMTAMTGDGNGGYGRDTGYFVSLEPRS